MGATFDFGPKSDYSRADGPVGGSAKTEQDHVTQEALRKAPQEAEKMVASTIEKHLNDTKVVKKIEKSGFEMAEVAASVSEKVCDELGIPPQNREQIRALVSGSATAYSRSEETRRQEEQKQEESGARPGRGKEKDGPGDPDAQESERGAGNRRRAAGPVEKNKLIEELSEKITQEVKEALLAPVAEVMPASAKLFGPGAAKDRAGTEVALARKDLKENSFDDGAAWGAKFSQYGPLSRDRWGLG